MTPEKRTKMYLTSAVMWFAGTVVAIAGDMFALPDYLRGFAFGILLVALALLLLRRMRDEYIEQLWNAGVSLAFVAVVLAYLFAPFLEGLFDGLSAAAPRQDFVSSGWIGPLALLAFFVGFHVKWLRSAL